MPFKHFKKPFKAKHYDTSNIQGNALKPNPNVGRDFMQKKADAKFVKKANKKLKGFKYGVGVGP